MALVAVLRVLHAAHAMNVLATPAALKLCVVRWAWRLLWRLAVLSCCTWHDLQLRVLRLCFTRGKLACQTDLWARKKINTYPGTVSTQKRSDFLSNRGKVGRPFLCRSGINSDFMPFMGGQREIGIKLKKCVPGINRRKIYLA